MSCLGNKRQCIKLKFLNAKNVTPILEQNGLILHDDKNTFTEFQNKGNKLNNDIVINIHNHSEENIPLRSNN